MLTLTPRPPDLSLKVILVGNSSVGKSQFINYLITKELGNPQPQTTLSCDLQYTYFINITYNNVKHIVDVQVWVFFPSSQSRTYTLIQTLTNIQDTAGQERFNALTRTFFVGKHGAILFFAIDDRASFDAIPNWISLVKNTNTEDTKILLVGAKSDILDRAGMVSDVGLIQLTKIVSYDEAIKLARFHNFIGYCECSSKNGDKCDEVLDFLINNIYDSLPRDNTGSLDIASNTTNRLKLKSVVENSTTNEEKENISNCC